MVSTTADPHAVDVQPVTVFVAATQYVVPVVTVIDCVVAPPGDHTYVTGPGACAVSTADESVQLIVSLLVMVVVKASAAVPHADDVQPVAMLVTVTQ